MLAVDVLVAVVEGVDRGLLDRDGLAELAKQVHLAGRLLAHHRGRDARDAVKAAVMLEDVARTVHVARQLGTPAALQPTDVDALFARYQNVYGQERT